MESHTGDEVSDMIDRLDLSAIALPDDKINECTYFINLASNETDIDKFRWLVSAFFNAAYSFFEISALSAYNAFNDPENGDPIEDGEALEALGRYVKIYQNPKNPSYVNTSGFHRITKQFYEIRKGNTHHYPLSIMKTGDSIPEDFHFGYLTDEGTPALKFCREVMDLIHQVQNELNL